MSKSDIDPLGPRHNTPGNSVFLSLLIAFALLTGCAPITSSGGDAAAYLLPKPGATIEIGRITVGVENQFDFDPAALFNEALERALEEEQLLWTGNPAIPRFLFNARIMDYEPGNAFKRWVLPGWGSTVLEVRGEIQTTDSGAVAVVIENKRSVRAGGVFTIGAWKSIFDGVAVDLAREIKRRINGGGFTVSLVPYSEQSSGAVHTRNPLEIEVRGIKDMRPDKLRLGERTAAFGVKMSDIYPNRRVGEYLKETISDGLRTVGHKVGPSANGVTVDGELLTFRVETPATALYWDIIAEIKLRLLVKKTGQETGLTRVYVSKEKERTYVWPTESLIGKTVSASVADIVKQIQTDDTWNTFTIGTEHGR